MPDGVNIPGGPVFVGLPQPPDVPCDPTGDGWRGPQGFPGQTGPQGVPGVPGVPGTGSYSVQDAAFGAVGDGATDDTAAIQSAINAAAGHGALRFPATQASGAPAVYLSSFKLTVPSNSHLIIEPGATIKIANGANCDCFTFPFITVSGVQVPTTNVLIELYGTLDGNMANNTTHGYGISVDGTGIPGTPNFTSNVCVRGDRLGLIKNFHNGPINWTTMTNGVVDGIKMDGGGNSAGIGGAKGYYSYNSGFSNCIVSNITDLGLVLYGGVQKGFIRNCEVFSCQSSGAAIFSDTGQPLPNVDCEITGCELHDNANYGCYVGSNITTTFQKNCIVSNNHIFGNTNCGAIINQCDGVLFTGNFVHDNINANTVLPGVGFGDVVIRSNSSRVSVVGNTIMNPQVGRTDGKGYGIALDSPDYLQINDNRIGDYQTTMSMTAAIGGNWGLRGLSEGNYYGPRINTAGYFPADLSYYQTSSRQGVNYDMVTPAISGLISAQGSPVFVDGSFPSQAVTGVVPGRGLSIGWNKDLAQGTHHAGLGEVDLFVGGGLGSPGGFNIFQVQAIRITAGTYNSTTGAVSLTTSIPHTLTVGSAFKLSGVNGTFASDPTQILKLNNAWTATTGTTGSTLNFTGPIGQDILSITGGAVVFSGEIEAGVVNTAVGVSGSLLANDGYGNTRLGGALVHGAMQTWGTLANAGTVTVNANTSFVLIRNSASIASAAVVLPAPASFQFSAGAELELNFQNPIGALTVTAASGATVVNPPTAIAVAGASANFVNSGSIWLRRIAI